MIAVIADDFTGAGELAAVGLRYGLNAEVQTVFDPHSKADLLAIDTDTRSRTPQEAAAEVEKVAEQLQQMPVEWIYKKVDSVMRGHVLAELAALLAALNMPTVLLVPANPSQGRTVANGRYFIDGRPLSETEFANDPEYPATSSDVLRLLGSSSNVPTYVLQHHQPIHTRAIVVGEAQSRADLLAWAARLDSRTIPAGAAEFFAAALEATGFRLSVPDHQDKLLPRKRALFICGSGSRYSRKAVEKTRTRGLPVSTMPLEFLQTDIIADELLCRWADCTLSAFEKSPQVLVATDQPIGPDPPLAQRIRRFMALLVENVLGRTAVDELCIEGGATASAVVRHMRWRRFFPCQELAPGVVRMRIEEKKNQFLTVKPGSYLWPKKIWPPNP